MRTFHPTTLASLGAICVALALPASAQASQGGIEASAPDAEGTDGEPLEADQNTRPGGEYGPFFEDEAVTEISHPTPRPRAGQPLFGVAQGAFCFVEDTGCRSSLIADFDFGVGLNVVASDRGLDVPLTQWRVRGGFTFRPLYVARDRWHRWGVGITYSFSQATPQVSVGRTDSSDALANVDETKPLRASRVQLVNQLWMSQRRNALHVDFSIGAVRSTVLDAGQLFWGTSTELAVGWGGLASFYASTDFLDRDLRAIFGFRTHAGIAGPIIGLLALGLAAGGAA